ncbi:MAG: hypothetical protein GXO43_02265 [Crenarchaeota archaeon]|nr:hypothetical protein [Thermoproteota archaeon]
MKAVFPSFAFLKPYIDSSEEIDELMYLIPEEHGIRITHIDKPRVVVINHFISDKDLKSYEVDKEFLNLDEEDRIVPLVIKDLKKALKTAKSASEVTIGLRDDDRAVVEVIEPYHSKSLMNIGAGTDWVPIRIPPLEYPSTIKAYGAFLRDMIRVAKETTAEFKFVVTEEGVKFIFEGLNIEQEITVPYESQNLISVEAEVGSRGLYGVGYVSTIMKSISAGDVLLIEFGENMPLHVRKTVGTDSWLEWYIAHRVEDKE